MCRCSKTWLYGILNTVVRLGSWQAAWRSLNTCNKPVIAAIQGGCYGAALGE